MTSQSLITALYLVDSVGNATFVSKLDLSRGYWHIPLTFKEIIDVIQYTVDMCGVPATNQWSVTTVLSGLTGCH